MQPQLTLAETSKLRPYSRVSRARTSVVLWRRSEDPPWQGSKSKDSILFEDFCSSRWPTQPMNSLHFQKYWAQCLKQRGQWFGGSASYSSPPHEQGKKLWWTGGRSVAAKYILLIISFYSLFRLKFSFLDEKDYIQIKLNWSWTSERNLLSVSWQRSKRIQKFLPLKKIFELNCSPLLKVSKDDWLILQLKTISFLFSCRCGHAWNNELPVPIHDITFYVRRVLT